MSNNNIIPEAKIDTAASDPKLNWVIEVDSMTTVWRDIQVKLSKKFREMTVNDTTKPQRITERRRLADRWNNKMEARLKKFIISANIGPIFDFNI